MKNILFFLFTLSLLFAQLSYAKASLSFSPQRLVLEGNTSSATLRLTNRGSKVGTFRISLSDVIYNNDGSIKHTNTPPRGFPSARHFVRFSPSQVRLAPGETQRVRMMLRSPRSIPNGELRIHAVFTQLPEPGRFGAKKNKVIRVNLALSQAVAIPIIIRRGNVSTTGGIGSLQRQKNTLTIRLVRSGAYSLYTTIEVYSRSKKNANRVALIRGVSVPVPNRQRLIKVKLKDNGQRGPYIVVVKDNNTGKVLAQKNVR